ncbi:MAG: squalene/phytoene synthase family protein [Pseudomonadota bacterium]
MSLQACANLVAEGDPLRFRVVMTLPLDLRERLLPILAFNLEVSRAPYLTTEPMIARIRLQWWRDCMDEIYGGGEVRRHEVSTPLSNVLRAGSLDRTVFDDLITARETDIDGFDFQSWADLWSYLDLSGGALLAALGAAAGIEGPARRIGTGYAVAGWLRAVADLNNRGGQALPDFDGIPAFVDQAFEKIADRRGIKPMHRFGYLVPLILWQARQDPSAITDGRLEPNPLRAQIAFLRSLI